MQLAGRLDSLQEITAGSPVLRERGPAEGEGLGGGLQPPTFLKIIKSYCEKGVFNPPPPF